MNKNFKKLYKSIITVSILLSLGASISFASNNTPQYDQPILQQNCMGDKTCGDDDGGGNG